MPGVFVSYSRADRAFAEQVIRGLALVGVSAWWDENMGGVDWQEELETQIGGLAAVMVLWTPNSVGSKNVRDEARLALKAEKLVNVLHGVSEPPFPFDRVNGLPLDTWSGREPHGGWSRLVQTLDELMAQAGDSRPGDFIRAQSRRDQDMKLKQQALAAALGVLQAAQAREAEVAAALAQAEQALETATDQLRRVAEMRANAAILQAAHGEIEGAQAARGAAEQRLQQAKAAVAEASRTLALATAELEAPFTEPLEPATRRRKPRSEASRVGAFRPDPFKAEASRTGTFRPEPAKPEPVKPEPVKPEPVRAAPAKPDLVVEPPPPRAGPDTAPLKIERAASASTPAERKTAPRRVAIVAAVVVGGLALAGVGAVAVAQLMTHAQPDASAQAAKPTPAEQLAQSLAGAWSSPGMSCKDTVRASIAVHDGAIYCTIEGTTSAFKIQDLKSPTVIDTTYDGAGYQFDASKAGALTISGLSSPLKMSRCAE